MAAASVNYSSALIVLTLGAGVDQGSMNRDVRVGDCVDHMIAVACDAGGKKTCPTNETIRTGCPGAIIVPWINNTLLDNGVNNALSSWNNGAGSTSGSQSQSVYNTSTGEWASVSFTWVTLPGNIIEITIDAQII